ncbi:MAG: serine/threonine protein phosphatase [Candidatus Lokiarchaeota archaeon]|nr:serine/threonine protein phosphatase [Candidatus Harpocratesius repetitus]
MEKHIEFPLKYTLKRLIKITQSNANQIPNELRDQLYYIGNLNPPQYVWQWFFRYFAAGSEKFKSEPVDLLENYENLFLMAEKLLEHKYTTEKYHKFIRDMQTPDYTYYFVGDTHGSFDDTYLMIDYFIKVFQVNPKVKVIWIGDIVDRNPYDLQNLAFILSFWILFPDNVFILRGNHEDSSVCSRYGFSQHLFEKAQSRERFEMIWKLITDFFSKLPLGLIFRSGNKQGLVVHGGIPFDVSNYAPIRIDEIESNLNCYQLEHFDMDVYSQTILWSDPDPELKEMVAPTPRTGRPRFSEQAFRDFMELNGFNLFIRGHQKFSEGYHLFWDNRLISLFSTSTYDGKKIGNARFLRLLPETSISEIGPEEEQRKGIVWVNKEFLEHQLMQYYHAKTSH